MTSKLNNNTILNVVIILLSLLIVLMLLGMVYFRQVDSCCSCSQSPIRFGLFIDALTNEDLVKFPLMIKEGQCWCLTTDNDCYKLLPVDVIVLLVVATLFKIKHEGGSTK